MAHPGVTGEGTCTQVEPQTLHIKFNRKTQGRRFGNFGNWGIGLKKQFKSFLKSSMHKDFHCGIVCGNAKSKIIRKWLSKLSYINLTRVNTVSRTSVHTHNIANIPHIKWHQIEHTFIMAAYVCGQNISEIIEKMKTAILWVNMAVIIMTFKC